MTTGMESPCQSEASLLERAERVLALLDEKRAPQPPETKMAIPYEAHSDPAIEELLRGSRQILAETLTARVQYGGDR